VRAGKADQIRLTVGDHRGGMVKVVNAADGEHRDRGKALPEARGQVAKRDGRVGHVSHLGRERGRADVGRVRDVEELDREVRDQRSDNLLHLVRAEPARQELIGAQPQTERELTVEGLSHLGENLTREPHPPLKSPAITVGAGVGHR